ncbi:hypothetical protein SSAG_02097 [Streptomyces sp. Mg1]|nr:hypothetical protein SSAG_02097 [Streptomyces sp. Mg1]
MTVGSFRDVTAEHYAIQRESALAALATCLSRATSLPEALAGTRHEANARLSAATAAETGVKDGDVLAVTGPAGSVELPLRITEMPDRVVWLPLNSTGRGVLADAGARPGTLVRIGPATPADSSGTDAEVGA